MSLNDLKTARLVCHEWNDIGSNLLGRRAYLIVNKMFRYDRLNLHKLSPVTDKLTRRLLIFDVFQPNVQEEKTVDIFFQMITQIFSQATNEIKLYVTKKEFAYGFLQGIALLKITNLQHVSIVISAEARTLSDENPVQEFPKLPIQVNLTSIKFQPNEQNKEIGLPAFDTFLQVLIDSAPNLTSLDISGIACPNLESCKNLKVLKFRFSKSYYADPGKLSVTTKILPQVKDSLTDMIFRYCGNNCVAVGQVNCN